ncbi:replication restart helicase PriA [Geofilum sp. OHC36d9]|uniref:replication restart helicase PriA n=1 Tax=Geofilum sp. OHC36d9 TaxID=3458413 RepID=UPI0040334C42
MFADIILPVPLPLLFTYEIPSELKNEVQTGCRVVVSFGKKRMLSGVVFSLHNKAPEAYETKPILSVLDDAPVITTDQLQLWQWIADYYQCTLGEVYKAALPSGLKLESETRIACNSDFEAESPLSNKQSEILDFLSGKKQASIQEINDVTGLKNSYPIVKQLIELEAVFVNERIQQSYRPKKEPFLSLHPGIHNENDLRLRFEQLERAPKQLHCLMTFLQKSGGVESALKGGEIAKKELLTASDSSAAPIAELIKKEILQQSQHVVSRLDNWENTLKDKKPLSDEQNTALNEVKEGFNENRPVLLHGVTSSGKTELYIHLIDDAIKQGRQALYLLPEIALTTQITSRLKAHFGDKLGIYHSKFSDAERVEVWNNLLQHNGYEVVLGVRSAIFLPFTNLGLIIVDEEHESSFKQYDPAPRYHARNVALVMARQFNANVLLGTATPSIESYFNAQTGKYKLVELSTRYEGIELPDIVVVDTRDARRRKTMKGLFSPALTEAMTTALNRKEQVILFQNRRGFAPYLECTMCAHIPKCPHCDVSLTYHKHLNHLVCHYCGYTTPTFTTCPACGNPSLELRGFGTQKVEEEIQQLFPEARVARMDLDTTRSKKGYENIISSFENGEMDILVGTQMVTKGLDFDRVSLVGILNADGMLNNPDFRAFERSFQMMAQVSGRAGRKNRRGTVVLQTSNPEHPVIDFVKRNDFAAFYQQQIEERQAYKYPPFYRLVHLTIRHKNQNVTHQAAVALGNELRKVFGSRVLGPQMPPINKIQDLYLERIMLKMERKASVTKSKQLMQNCINTILSQQRWRYVAVAADVDPL